MVVVFSKGQKLGKNGQHTEELESDIQIWISYHFYSSN